MSPITVVQKQLEEMEGIDCLFEALVPSPNSICCRQWLEGACGGKTRGR